MDDLPAHHRHEASKLPRRNRHKIEGALLELIRANKAGKKARRPRRAQTFHVAIVRCAEAEPVSDGGSNAAAGKGKPAAKSAKPKAAASANRPETQEAISNTINRKRDFKRLRAGRRSFEARKQAASSHHKHDATRLHYDLRLEHDGVLGAGVTAGSILYPMKAAGRAVEDRRSTIAVRRHHPKG